jgi:hydrogenase maturation protein HypF
VGRLFDAAAALVGLVAVTSYEAEAAMRLEALCTTAQAPVMLPLARDDDGLWRTDWGPLVALLTDEHRPLGVRAGQFHASLARALLDQALVIREETGVERVALSGGVFQNRFLTESVLELLVGRGFRVALPRLLPQNDAAISFGQLIEGNALRGAPCATPT